MKIDKSKTKSVFLFYLALFLSRVIFVPHASRVCRFEGLTKGAACPGTGNFSGHFLYYHVRKVNFGGLKTEKEWIGIKLPVR